MGLRDGSGQDTNFAIGCNTGLAGRTVTDIGIGLVGGGYMGKAHAVALSAVGAVFDTALRPRLEMIAASSQETAEGYRSAYRFARAARDWRDLVADPRVEAVVIASPQSTHRAIAEAAFAAGNRDAAAERLLASIQADRAWNDGAARAKLLQIFEAVGLEDPWVAATRRRLSLILFG